MYVLAVEAEFTLSARRLGHHDDPIPDFDATGLRYFDDFAGGFVTQIGGFVSAQVGLEFSAHGRGVNFDDDPVFAGSRVGNVDNATLF